MNPTTIYLLIDWNSSMGATLFWELCERILDWNVDEYIDDLTDECLSKEQVYKSIAENDEIFSYKCEFGTLSLIYLYNPKVEVLKLTINNSDLSSASDFLIELIASNYFSYGYISNQQYVIFQNTENIDYLRNNGIDDGDFSKINNGLPFPLNKEIIDVSKKPGRKILLEGDIEAVGSIMWLSDQWLEKHNVVISDVECLSKKAIQQGVLFKFYDKCFDRWDGEQREIQNRIWRQLYGQE